MELQSDFRDFGIEPGRFDLNLRFYKQCKHRKFHDMHILCRFCLYFCVEPIDNGYPGDLVALSLDVEADFQRGQIVSDSNYSPATECSSFTAHFTKVVAHSPLHINPGYTPVVHCGTAQVPCKFELLELVDGRSGHGYETNPKFLKLAATALVRLTPLKPLCAVAFSENKQLGSIVVRDIGKTIGVGRIRSVERHG